MSVGVGTVTRVVNEGKIPMPNYTLGLRDDPSDHDNSAATSTPLVNLTAASPDGPITGLRLTTRKDAAEQLALAQEAMDDYAAATGKQMTASQLVRFFGSSAVLTEDPADESTAPAQDPASGPAAGADPASPRSVRRRVEPR